MGWQIPGTTPRHYNAQINIQGRDRYAAALLLNRNLAVFANYDPISLAGSKSRRAPRTAVGLIG
jgi:hypothetical protein